MGKIRTTIYIPEELWKKFCEIVRRDRDKMSGVIEGLVRDWVHRKDPGNPQRPLTAWDPGHEDQEKLQEKELYTWIYEYADEHGGEIYYKNIIRILREAEVTKTRIAAMTVDFAKRLSKDGIGVVR